MRFEVLFLPGLQDVVAAEVERVLGAPARPVAGRDDSLAVEFGGSWQRLLTLRTAVAVFAVRAFPVPRPRSLLSGEYLPAIVDTVTRVAALDPGATSFRFEAAGAGTVAFQRLAQQLAADTGLAHDPAGGAVVLRFRRSGHTSGWDVLVRMSARPLSARPWRVRDLPGAVNATIAAAITALTDPDPADRVVNLMCGSGTLLVERLLAAPVWTAVGVDIDPAAVDACRQNLAAAGLPGRATLLAADIAGDQVAGYGPFDVILADPPWGGLVGSHDRNEALHRVLLDRAYDLAAPDARCAVLTHEVRLMQRCLRRAADRWQVCGVTRVFQKGHHPRIYLLRPRAAATRPG